MTWSHTGFAAFASEHRFRLVVGGCLLAIALMIVLIHATVGLGPPWGSPAVAVT